MKWTHHTCTSTSFECSERRKKKKEEETVDAKPQMKPSQMRWQQRYTHKPYQINNQSK